MNYQEKQEQTTSLQPTDSFVDQVLVGRYKILGELGKGGMSTVYKARHLLLNRMVAVKIMHSKHIADPAAILRFKQEAAAASKLSHPNIITVHDFDVAGERPFQAIDFLEGTSLLDEITRLHGLPLNRSLPIFLQICAGMGHAHANGIIHRDLKPSNVMLTTQDGNPDFVKIVDFGIAKILPQEGKTIHQLTQTGEVFGSPYYMSPEQCLGRRLDARADIYSMGCLMFEVITGNPPFMGSVVFETIQKHIDEMPPSLKDFVKDQETARQLDFVICKAMAKDPAQRYQTMEEMAHDLEPIASGNRANWLLSTSQRASIIAIRTAQWLKNKPVRLVGTLAVIIALLSAFGAAPPVIKFATARVPSFRQTDWPLFSPEASSVGGAGQTSTMTDAPEIKAAMTKFAENIENLSGEEPAQQALRFRDMAAADARAGLYESAAALAGQLHLRLDTIGPAALEKSVEHDRAKMLEEYSAIADACYLAPPSGANNANAFYFYDLASKQMGDVAELALRRFQMKMAGIKLRQGRPNEAEIFLQRASGVPGGYPRGFFESKHPLGIYDRAVYYSLIGDATGQLGRYKIAAIAYPVAQSEWLNLNEPQNAAQASYLTGYYELKATTDKVTAIDAEHNLLEALKYYQGVSQPDSSKLAAIYGQLAEATSRQGNTFASWSYTFKSKLETMQIAH